jgi:hypothetical protein
LSADVPEFRLILRYAAEARLAFARGYADLVKTLERDAARDEDEEIGWVSEAQPTISTSDVDCASMGQPTGSDEPAVDAEPAVPSVAEARSQTPRRRRLASFEPSHKPAFPNEPSKAGRRVRNERLKAPPKGSPG